MVLFGFCFLFCVDWKFSSTNCVIFVTEFFFISYDIRHRRMGAIASNSGRLNCFALTLESCAWQQWRFLINFPNPFDGITWSESCSYRKCGNLISILHFFLPLSLSMALALAWLWCVLCATAVRTFNLISFISCVKMFKNLSRQSTPIKLHFPNDANKLHMLNCDSSHHRRAEAYNSPFDEKYLSICVTTHNEKYSI